MIASATTRLETLLPLLRCPACRNELVSLSQTVRCRGCAVRYPVVNGRPSFLPGGQVPRVHPDSHLSNCLSPDAINLITWTDGWVLNLGAGGTAEKYENCVEVEYAVFRNTDVVADAHDLPFADESFAAVVTYNTFEHLADPERAASEVQRVLKPGGRLMLRTAFLQPVHEAPYHFYNTTEYGLRRWFREFDIRSVTVTENFNPAYVFAWLASEVSRELAAHAGEEEARRFLESPLSYWREGWVTGANRNDALWKTLGRLPQEVQARFAAGFHLEAVKPAA